MKLIINTDGAARGNPGPAAAAFVLKSSAGNLQEICGKYLGETTNNDAEYLACIEALKRAKEILSNTNKYYPILTNTNQKIEEILIKSDSLLLVSQLTGKWKIKDRNLQQKVMEVKKLEKEIGCKIDYMHIPRELNREADREANRILDSVN